MTEIPTVETRGNCEMCERTNRVLSRIESGHLVCRICLREFTRPHRPKHHETTKEPKQLPKLLVNDSDKLTQAQTELLEKLHVARSLGFDFDMTTPEPEINAALEGLVHDYHTKVTGITRPNWDGTSRQPTIEKCTCGEQVQLVRDTWNQYDEFAVKVCRKNHDQIGYLKAGLFKGMNGCKWCIAEYMDAGVSYDAWIHEIYEFEQKEDAFLGVEIVISCRTINTSR